MHRVVLFLIPLPTCPGSNCFRFICLSCVLVIFFFGSFLQKDIILHTFLCTLLGATHTPSGDLSIHRAGCTGPLAHWVPVVEGVSQGESQYHWAINVHGRFFFYIYSQVFSG